MKVMLYNEKPKQSDLLTEPADGPSLDAILEQETGREMFDISNKDVRRSPAYNSEIDGVEVAGIGGKLGRLFGLREINAPKTDLLLKEGQEASQKPPEFPEDMTPEQIQELTGEPQTAQTLEPTAEEIIETTSPEFEPVDTPTAEEYVNEVSTYRGKDLEARTWARNINLDYVENAEDIGAVLEANAALWDEAPKRGFKEVEAEVEADTAELLAPILQGKQNGLLNDRQMLAGRRLLVSMSNRVSELTDKIAQGAGTPEDMLAFEKMLSQTAMLQKYMQGQVRETARALNSMRINAKTLNGKNAEAMVEAVNAGGTSKTTAAKAKILADLKATGMLDDTGDYLNGVNELVDKKTTRALVNYWAAALLTGPKTQMTNFVSNSFIQLLETMVVKPMAAGIGSTRRMVTGATDGVGFDEASYEFLGMIHAFKDATIMAGRALRDGVKTGEYQSSYGERRIDDVAQNAPTLAEGLNINAVSKNAGKVVDIYQRGVEAFSFGLLTAGDEFFKTLAYRKALYSQAARNAYEKGLSGDELAADINKQLNNVTEDLHNGAIAVSEQQTFTNNPHGFIGDMGTHIKELSQKYPAMKFVAPFINTPANLFNYALEIGPTAVLSKTLWQQVQKGGADADIALAKMAFGSSMFGSIYMMHQEGKITGGGPKNMAQKAAWDASGRQPYSVFVDGKWIAYDRATDPLGMALASVAGAMDMIDYAKDEQDAQTIAATMIFAMAGYATDSTYLSGIGSIMQMVDGNKPVDRYAARLLAGFIPRAFQTFSEITDADDTKRTTYPSSGFWDSMDKYINAKVDRQDLNPLRYWDGEIAKTPYLYNSLSPISVTQQKADPASEAMIRNGVGVIAPRPQVTISGNVIQLSDSTEGDALYDKMLEFVGKERRKAVDSLVKSKGFDKLELGVGGDQFLRINEALDSGRKAGMDKFVNYLFKEVGNNKEKYGDIAIMFDGRTLAGIVSRANRGTLSPDEMETTKNVKFKNVKSREGFRVPGI